MSAPDSVAGLIYSARLLVYNLQLIFIDSPSRRSSIRFSYYYAIVLKHLFPKKYRMVFCAGLRDPCTRDVARLSESVNVFLRFPKVEQHPKCMDHAILHGKTI